ncbi:hypothetical protein OB08_04520 [Microbacterium sp. HJ5]
MGAAALSEQGNQAAQIGHDVMGIGCRVPAVAIDPHRREPRVACSADVGELVVADVDRDRGRLAPLQRSSRSSVPSRSKQTAFTASSPRRRRATS